MNSINLSQHHKTTLLRLARESIIYGCDQGTPMTLNKARAPAELLDIKTSCFVTLKRAYQLRGCIGSLRASQSIVEDVIEHAYAAAFQDYRFQPVTAPEIPDLHISISVISPQERIEFEGEADLLAQLHPGTDGLVLECKGHKATFLPAVWEQLSEPQEFLDHLKLKAGLAEDYWSDNIQAHRYTTLYFEENSAA